MKCIECNSCFKYVWLGVKRYLYCTLCRSLYDLVDNKLVEITDPDLIRQAREIMGNRV